MEKINETENYSDHLKYFKIEGGNHSQFGDYGFQKGDGISAIDNMTQQDLTIQFILDNITHE